MLHVKSDLAPIYDIITISETWLKRDDKSTNFLLPDYQPVFRRDRHSGTLGYGGVLAWVSNKIACKRRHDFEHRDLEVLWLELKIDKFKFFLCVVYRPPNSGDDFWANLESNVNDVQSRGNGNIMIIGDTNADPTTRHGNFQYLFSERNNLKIVNNLPTRYSENNSTILDQCLTNFSNFVTKCDVLPPLATSDHCVLGLSLNIQFNHPTAYKRTMWDFERGNYPLYREKIENFDWDTCFANNDVDDVCAKFTKELIDIAKKSIPNKVVTIRPRDKPWYNGYLRRLRRHKERLFSRFKRERTLENWELFKNVRKEYASEINRVKRNTMIRKIGS
jgi:hypothetical protein